VVVAVVFRVSVLLQEMVELVAVVKEQKKELVPQLLEL
jgi:hypothetical protein